MRDQSANHDVLVVGGGIIGLASALRLQGEGFRVALVEPNGPASGASSGNGGSLSTANIFPPAAIGSFKALPRLLLDRSGPLVIRPSYLLRFLPWGMRAARANLPANLDKIIASMATIITRALDDYRTFLPLAGAEDLLVHRGSVVIFKSLDNLEKRMGRAPVWNRHGVDLKRLSREEVLAMEPSLARDLVGGIHFPGSAHFIDPLLLGVRIAEAFERNGGQIVRAKVRALRPRPDNGWTAIADGGELIADKVVVSAGRWSDALLRPLGYRMCIEGERGYHLMLPQPRFALSRPVSIGDAYFTATPMSGGIRLAGTAEFASERTPPDYSRATMLYDLAKTYFPGLSNAGATAWMGVRPSLPDMLPAIGGNDRHKNLYYSFGHSHNGVMLASISARVLADHMMGRRTSVDIEPFSLSRFD